MMHESNKPKFECQKLIYNLQERILRLFKD